MAKKAAKKKVTKKAAAPAKKAATKKKVAPKKAVKKKAAPAKKAPAKKAPAKKAPAKKAPAKKAPVKKAPAKKAATKKTPAKKVPAKKTSTKKAPAKKASRKKSDPNSPANQTPLRKRISAKKRPVMPHLAQRNAPIAVPAKKAGKPQKLSATFLKKQRQKLLDLRDTLVDQMNGVARDTLGRGEDNADSSAFGMHQADAGSDSYDRDFALNILSQEQDAIHETAAGERLLPGDRAKLLDGVVEDFLRVGGLADPLVDGNLDEARDLHRVVVAELLGERLDHLVVVALLEPGDVLVFHDLVCSRGPFGPEQTVNTGSVRACSRRGSQNLGCYRSSSSPVVLATRTQWHKPVSASTIRKSPQRDG